MSIITNVYLWIGTTMFFLLTTSLLFIFLIVIKMKTHAMIEFKSWMKGQPIALFFQDNRYCEWKVVSPEAGIIQDEHYGAFIVNEKATYIDKLTKNVLIPFDASFAASINVKAAKLIEDFGYMFNDDENMKMLRQGIAQGLIDDSESLDVLKTSINFGAVKTMMNALVPHNINAKIEKVIASRMKNYGNVNVPQIAMLFAAVFGAILLGALIIKLAFPKS